MLGEVAAGRFPAADGGVTILPQDSPREAGVIGFTAHAVIFVDADPAWVASQLPPGDLSGPLTPAFLQALCARTGRRAQSIDLLSIATPLSGDPPIDLVPITDRRHPRIARAYHYRDDIRAWQADGGIVLIGRGVAGRWETAIEVDPDRRGSGLGRQLATAARHLVPTAGSPPAQGSQPAQGALQTRGTLWAQVAPGNAASVRAFLAAGFVPVGAEALLTANPE